jgi:hypothetical protein
VELDRHKLEEERRWRFENYKRQVERLVSMIVDAIQTEGRRVLEREIAYSDDMRDEYSYVRQAGDLQRAILQAVNNADFGGLTRDAGDLHAVCEALHALAKFKGELSEETRRWIEQAEDGGLRVRIAAKVAGLEEVERRDREGCIVAVHESGRGVGFHRCQFEGKQTIRVTTDGKLVADDDPKGVEVRVCTRHANDARKHGLISVYRPWNEWEERQRIEWRTKERREIAAMQRQLGELVEGEAQKEIGPA